MKSSLRAFSLIEMLATVAIIGTLAALLVPLVGRMKENAARTTCVANLRQLGLGLRTYAQDNQGVLPLSLNPDPLAPDTQVSWQILVQRELDVKFPKAGERSVFICPSARKTYSQLPYRTYALNLAGGSPTADPPRLQTLSQPSNSALLVESRHETNGAGYNAISGSVAGVGGRGRLDYRHDGHMNMLMADGSVRLLTATEPTLDDLLLNIRK
jgi:prepilin-type N-terminal cleavage/methylation domain-containing protein/prepilin-type processing-associated H-X9-DG protein